MSEKLNVIFLGGFNYPIGMAGTKRVQFFIDRFIEKEIDVKVMTIGNVNDASIGNLPKGVHKGVQYYNLGASLPKSLISYIFFPFLQLNAITKIFSFKKKKSKNILFVYNGISIDIFPVVWLAKIFGYKIIVDVVEDYRTISENLSAQLKLKYKSTIFFENRLDRFSDYAVVISGYLDDLLKNKLHLKLPVSIIPVSSNLSAEPYAKKNFSSPLKITYTGSFGNKDGLPYLITAFNKFSEIYLDSTLIFTGSGNNPGKIVKDSNNNKIKYAGFLSDEEYHRFLLDADILCMTRINSKYANAGFPFKLGEYLATGNPVIVTNVGDVSLYIKNETDAKIIAPENSDELFNALVFYAEDFKRARDIGQNGRKKSLEHFNYKTNGDKLITIMENL